MRNYNKEYLIMNIYEDMLKKAFISNKDVVVKLSDLDKVLKEYIGDDK
jgi:ribosomal protein S17E